MSKEQDLVDAVECMLGAMAMIITEPDRVLELFPHVLFATDNLNMMYMLYCGKLSNGNELVKKYMTMYMNSPATDSDTRAMIEHMLDQWEETDSKTELDLTIWNLDDIDMDLE